MSQEVVGKSDLVNLLAGQHGITKASAERILKHLGTQITLSVREGKKVRFPELGIFSRIETREHTVRNPQTGEPVKVPEKVKIRFRMSASAREALAES